jgi:hypothetical protein
VTWPHERAGKNDVGLIYFFSKIRIPYKHFKNSYPSKNLSIPTNNRNKKPTATAMAIIHAVARRRHTIHPNNPTNHSTTNQQSLKPYTHHLWRLQQRHSSNRAPKRTQHNTTTSRGHIMAYIYK